VFGQGRHHQEGVGEHRQGGPAVPRPPAAHLMLVQAAQALAGLKTLFHRPTPPGDFDQDGQRGGTGRIAAVEGQLAGLAVAADHEPVLACLLGGGRAVVVVQAHKRPVVQAVALGAPAARHLLPRPRRDLGEQAVGAVSGAAEGHMVIAGDRQDISDSSSLQRSAQLGVGAVDLVAGDPGRRDPASSARMIIRVARAGLVANPTSSGTPAACKRSGSLVQDRGRYSSRSITACPASVAYTRYTATWAFSMRPAVPVYWRCTPTVPVPFLRSPVSSTTSTASGSPKCSVRYPRTSSRSASASHTARPSRCCIPSGLGSPACSAIVQQFLRGRSASRPRTNALARRRRSTRPNRPATRPSNSSNNSCHWAGSTSRLWPAATV